MCRHIGRDGGAVVGHVDGHIVTAVGTGMEGDTALRSGSLGCILEKIADHTAHQALIGIDEKIIGRDRHADLPSAAGTVGQKLGLSRQERLDIEQRRGWSRHTRELPVVLDKLHQLRAGLVDDLQPLARLAIGRGEQGLGERDDGCHGVHDFVGEHTDELHPGVYLLVGQLVVDVAEGHHPHLLASQQGTRLAAREAAQHLVDLTDMGDGVAAEHLAGSLIRLDDNATVLLHDKDARIDRVEDELIELLFLHLLVAGMAEHALHTVERVVHHLGIAVFPNHGEAEAVVATVDGIEQEFYATGDAAVLQPQQDAGRERDCQCENDDDPCHGLQSVFLDFVVECLS